MNVLIIEDERPILDDLVDSVRAFSADVTCTACASPSAALAAVEADSFDLALLDIQMPEMTGIELARILTRECPWLRIVFITAYNNYASEAYDLEVLDYLLKPVRRERLLKTLDKAFREGQNHRRLAPVSPAAPAGRPPHVQAFGSLVVAYDGHILKWKRQKSAELFACLLMHLDRPVSKYKLCDDLFPETDTDKALVSLQTAIYQLRRNLDAFTREQITVTYGDNHYRMQISGCTCDVVAFERAYDQAFRRAGPTGSQPMAADKEQLEHLVAACQLYTAPFLAQDSWLWALSTQTELELRYRTVLVALIDHCLESDQTGRLAEYLGRLARLVDENLLDATRFKQIRHTLI